MSAPCNFCEFTSSRYGSGSEHSEEAVLREEVERLQSLIKKMTGRDDDVSFTELEAHKKGLKVVLRNVQAQMDKVKPEEAEPVEDGIRRGVLVPPTTRSEKRPVKRNDQLLKWKRLTSESLQSKLDTLCLLNERMNGIGVESMTSYDDLRLLECQITHALINLNQQMMSPLEIAVKIKTNPKRTRRDLSKKVRVLCDFCGLSSSNRCEQCPNKQEDDESLQSMENEVKRLRILTRRMTGNNIDGLSFTELDSLETNLRKALLIVENQREKTELEEAERKKRKQSLRPLKQKREAGDKDEATMTSFGEKRVDEDLNPRQSRMRIEYERLKSESMQSQLERLWLLKERMSGRELGDMTSSALLLVELQIRRGLIRMGSLPI